MSGPGVSKKAKASPGPLVIHVQSPCADNYSNSNSNSNNNSNNNSNSSLNYFHNDGTESSNNNSNSNSNHNNMAYVRNNKKPKGRPTLLILLSGFLLIVAVITISLNSREIDDVSLYSSSFKRSSKLDSSDASSSSLSSSSSSSIYHRGRNSKYITTFDVNAPPIPKQQPSFWETDSTADSTATTTTAGIAGIGGFGSDYDSDGMDMDRNSFIFWGQQANRMQETSSSSFLVKKKTKKKTKKRKSSSSLSKQQQKNLQPFPVIDETDDQVPSGAAGFAVRAADALMCRESVVDYVINATDLKDECDGMKKAFTKYCTTDGADTQTTTSTSSPQQEPPETEAGEQEQEQEQPHQDRHRRLTTTENEYMDNYQYPKNPVIALQNRLKRLQRHLRWWWDPQSAVSAMGDLILKEFDHAAAQLNKTFTAARKQAIQYGHGHGYRRHHQHRHRLLLTGENDAEKEENDDIEDKDATLNEHQNEEATNNDESDGQDNDENKDEDNENPIVEESKPPVVVSANKTTPIKKYSLSLPTNVHHLSEKALGETLMLHQEDMIMASVKAAQNNTNATVVKEAVADAAASSKAVADTADYVSSVLNDPTSVEARTCCTSILNVFHETCEVDEEEELSDSFLFIVVAVVAMCGMIKSLIRHFQIRWLPEAAGCILVGVAAGWGLSYFPHHDISFDGHWFLRILVPPIVFEAALGIDKRSFNRHVVPILIYAIMGTLMATVITAIVVHEGSLYFRGYCETIPYIEALTFGALISSIDPIAVLSVLSNMGMTDTDTIYVVIFGESLLNDGIAIVLFETLKHFLDDNMKVDGDAVVAATIHFFVVAIGSLLVGLASGICCTVYYWMMHGCQTPLVEVLTFCCWALLPYYICDGIEWSGIVAVVAVGFVMDMFVVGQHHLDDSNHGHGHGYSHEESPSSGNLMLNGNGNGKGKGRERRRRQIFNKEGHLSIEAKTHIGFVTEIIATMMETSIFAYLGLFLFSSRYHWNIYHTMIAIGGCCISRAVMIPTLSTLANMITRTYQIRGACSQQLPQQQLSITLKQDKPAGVVIDKKMQLVLWFAGLRGAMSFALVENIPLYDPVTGEGTALKSELKAMTCACIIFTVFILGGCTFYMMDSLGMAPQGGGDHKPSMLDREMEMIGLLTKQKSNRVESEGTAVSWDGEDETIYPGLITPPRSQNSSFFRQRINQAS